MRARLPALVAERLRWLALGNVGAAAVAQNVVVRVFLLFVNLGNSVFTARHLGAEGRGTQAAIGLWLIIITYFSMLGLPAALSFQGRKHAAERQSLFGAGLLIGTLLGLVGMIVGIVIMPFVIHKYGPDTIRDAQIIMLFAPINMVGFVVSAMLEVQFKFSFLNFTRYVPPVVTLCMLIGLGLLHHITPMNAVLAYVLPGTVMTLGTAVYLFITFTPKFSDFARSTRRLLGYGVRIAGSDLLATFSTQIDQVLVVGILSASQLGGYTIALQASRVINIFQTSLNAVLLPKAAGLPTHSVVDLVARTARLTIASTVLAGVALVLLLPFLLPRFYGHDFASVIFVTQILVIEATLAAGASTHTQAFTATNRPGMATVFQLGGLLTAVPLLLLLLPRLGLIGAAIALTGSSFLRLLLALISYPILLKTPIPNLILTQEDLKYLSDAVLRRKT